MDATFGMPVASAIFLMERLPPSLIASNTCWLSWRNFISHPVFAGSELSLNLQGRFKTLI
jgi:hypothetical protein